MTSNVFDNTAFNAVIVGNGAIGAAMLDQLLGLAGLNKAFLLARGAAIPHADSRVHTVCFDAVDADSIAAAATEVARHVNHIHVLFNTVGLLHDADNGPEKRLKALQADYLLRSFQVNAMLLPLLAQQFSPLLKHQQPSVLASLSARVGSISDNSMGGWYSYRASKAAHNMLLKTIALEWRTSHRNAAVVALHPGTVHSRLSEPFLTPRYKNTVLTPEESAGHLYTVMRGLTAENSGEFLDWQGKPIDW